MPTIDDQLTELSILRNEAQVAMRRADDPHKVWDLFLTLRDLDAVILDIARRSVRLK